MTILEDSHAPHISSSLANTPAPSPGQNTLFQNNSLQLACWMEGNRGERTCSHSDTECSRFGHGRAHCERKAWVSVWNEGKDSRTGALIRSAWICMQREFTVILHKHANTNMSSVTIATHNTRGTVTPEPISSQTRNSSSPFTRRRREACRSRFCCRVPLPPICRKSGNSLLPGQPEQCVLW